MGEEADKIKAFWDANPCDATLSEQEDPKKYFEEIESKRYNVEWHIPIIAKFEEHKDKDVLEIGCGIATDGLQFARAGARYTGIDLTPNAIRIAQERFKLFGVKGEFNACNAERLPFPDGSFDHVYSFGVIHVYPDTEAIVKEIYRVLRPGGTVCVMVYNRNSINYYIEIMFLRRIFRYLLYPEWAPGVIARITGLDEKKLRRHREIMLRNKKMTRAEWISINTDGPDCPFAKVYSPGQIRKMFLSFKFKDVRTENFFFDKSRWFLIGKIITRGIERFLGRRWGWHLVVYGRK